MAKYFEIRKDSEDYFEFTLKNCNISLANAIRRIILSEIEIYGIEDENIILTENTTPLHNEYISHRLSLVPVRQDKENLEKLEFYIAKHKTKNVPIENGLNGIMEITTNDVQVYNPIEESWLDPRDIFDGDFLITKLNLKQKLLGSFKITRNIAKNHSRWQCVSTASYRYLLEVDKIPGQDYDKITLEDEKNWVKRNGEEPLGFIFFLEPIGGLSGREIVKRALNVLREKCVSYRTFITANKEVFTFDKNGILEIEYEGETHTLGNLIATMGLEYEGIGEEDFIGYRIVHPMLNKFLLRLKVNFDIKEEARLKYTAEVLHSKLKIQNINVLIKLLGFIIELIEKLIKEWERV